MKITTKTGDRGHSGLYNGKRASKASAVFDAVGELDELNSFLGWARGPIDEEKQVWSHIDRLQEDIYKIMSIVGFEGQVPKEAKGLKLEDLQFLEAEIERCTSSMENLRSFVKPGTSEAAGRLHIVRCVCRRAERALIRYHEEQPLPELVLQYINRLSDLLFVWGLRFEQSWEAL